MKVTRITIGRGGSLNVGNYESFKPYVEMEAAVEEGETVENACAALVAVVTDALVAEMAPAFERMELWQIGQWKRLAGVPDEGAGPDGE